jgi:hypothetical protein
MNREPNLTFETSEFNETDIQRWFNTTATYMKMADELCTEVNKMRDLIKKYDLEQTGRVTETILFHLERLILENQQLKGESDD